MTKIKRWFRRAGSLVAKCEQCQTQGGPYHVPYTVDYEDEPGTGRSGLRVYRCEKHKPQGQITQ